MIKFYKKPIKVCAFITVKNSRFIGKKTPKLLIKNHNKVTKQYKESPKLMKTNIVLGAIHTFGICNTTRFKEIRI